MVFFSFALNKKGSCYSFPHMEGLQIALCICCLADNDSSWQATTWRDTKEMLVRNRSRESFLREIGNESIKNQND